MNLHVFCIHISIMLLLQYALSKTLPANVEIDSILSDSETNDSSDDNTKSIHETNHRSFKHSRNDRLKGHIRRRRASEDKSSIKKQCAVMYKNDEPVGILQPYKDTYQFLPIHSDEHIPVEVSPYADAQNSMKRDTSLNTEDDEDSPELGDETLKKEGDNSQFSDDRYPYIFAKFKVDSRLEKPFATGTKQRAIHKRESLVDEKKSNSLSSTLSRIQSYDAGAEVDLRNILSDMGLIEDETQHVDKREVELNEDEDLEHGTNKINLIKLDNSEERLKRDDEVEKKTVVRAETATKHYEAIAIPEPKAINEEEYIDQYLNKNEDQPQEQEKQDREKRSDDVAVQMEREIKSKLQKIKEEVRSEIEKIKSSNTEEFEDSGEEDQEQSQEKLQRKKRHVISTLIDEESSDIDPVLSTDNRLVPHIRRIRKRSLNNEDMLPPDDTDDSEQEFIGSKNEAQLIDKTSQNAIGSKTVSDVDATETNLIIDLFSEIKGTQQPSSFIKPKRNVDESLEINIRKNAGSKSRTEIDERAQRINKSKRENKSTSLKSYDMILDRLTELENLEHGVKSIGNSSQTLTENVPFESTAPTNQYYATTEKHFLTRNLKQYDEESINDDDNANVEENNQDDKLSKNDKSINRIKRNCKCNNGDKDCKCSKSFEESEDKSSNNDDIEANSEENNEKINKFSLNKDTSLIRDKKSCKCNAGDKDCKCGKAPLKLLKGSDGVNFVYIDDVPRLADGPPSFRKISSEKENDKNALKMKLRPIPPEKKRDIKENMNYHKTVVNFAKNLRDGGYILDIDPDVYRITDENSKSVATRRKRNSFADLVAIHGGGPIIDHLVAIRERSMLPRIRVKRSGKTKDHTDQQLTLTDMSDEDLFGALPQSFEGELARYKRVKRTR